MTTALSKTVSRESTTAIFERSKRRPLIVSISPGNVIGLRMKGTRTTLEVSINAVWNLALAQKAAELRAARKAKKKGSFK